MLQTTWYLLLAGGATASYLAISRRLDERLGGVAATLLWALAAVGAFEIEQTRTVAGNSTSTFNNSTGNVTVTTEGGRVVTEASASPELGFLAVTFALTMLIFTLAAAAGELPSISNTRYGETR